MDKPDVKPTVSRMVYVGDEAVPFPKLVSGKALAIKDIIADLVVKFIEIKKESEKSANIAPNQDDIARLNELEEELFITEDEEKKADLKASIDALKLKMSVDQLYKMENAEKEMIGKLKNFVQENLDEGVFNAIAIALGAFDDTGNPIPYPIKDIKTKMTLDQVATVVGYIMEDLLETKKKFTEILGDLTNLMG